MATITTTIMTKWKQFFFNSSRNKHENKIQYENETQKTFENANLKEIIPVNVKCV